MYVLCCSERWHLSGHSENKILRFELNDQCSETLKQVSSICPCFLDLLSRNSGHMAYTFSDFLVALKCEGWAVPKKQILFLSIVDFRRMDCVSPGAEASLLLGSFLMAFAKSTTTNAYMVSPPLQQQKTLESSRYPERAVLRLQRKFVGHHVPGRQSRISTRVLFLQSLLQRRPRRRKFSFLAYACSELSEVTFQVPA